MDKSFNQKFNLFRTVRRDKLLWCIWTSLVPQRFSTAVYLRKMTYQMCILIKQVSISSSRQFESSLDRKERNWLLSTINEGFKLFHNLSRMYDFGGKNSFSISTLLKMFVSRHWVFRLPSVYVSKNSHLFQYVVQLFNNIFFIKSTCEKDRED